MSLFHSPPLIPFWSWMESNRIEPEQGNCLMLHYLEEKQHNTTAPFTVAKILMHCPLNRILFSLDFSEALESAPPVLTLTYVDNDCPQYIFHSFCYVFAILPLKYSFPCNSKLQLPFHSSIVCSLSSSCLSYIWGGGCRKETQLFSQLSVIL